MAILDYNAASIPARARRISILFWIGLGLFIFGTGPLLCVILAASLGWTKDPNPNPVMFGILAFFTFYPSVGLIIVGLALTMWRWVRRKRLQLPKR